MGFAEKDVSKETIIRRLNGKLRAALWGLVFLGSISSLGAAIWWWRSHLAQKKNEQTQDQLLRAIFVMDSTFKANYATKEDLRSVAEQVHPERHIVFPEEHQPEPPPDTAYWREQIQIPKEKK